MLRELLLCCVVVVLWLWRCVTVLLWLLRTHQSSLFRPHEAGTFSGANLSNSKPPRFTKNPTKLFVRDKVVLYLQQSSNPKYSIDVREVGLILRAVCASWTTYSNRVREVHISAHSARPVCGRSQLIIVREAHSGAVRPAPSIYCAKCWLCYCFRIFRREASNLCIIIHHTCAK